MGRTEQKDENVKMPRGWTKAGPVTIHHPDGSVEKKPALQGEIVRLEPYRTKGPEHYRGRPFWNEPFQRFLSEKITELEGEAVGFYLFGPRLEDFQNQWRQADDLEELGDFYGAYELLGMVETAILAETELSSLETVRQLLRPTSNGTPHRKSAVGAMLDRACRKAGARSRPELRVMVLRGLATTRKGLFGKIHDGANALRRAVYRDHVA